MESQCREYQDQKLLAGFLPRVFKAVRERARHLAKEQAQVTEAVDKAMAAIKEAASDA